MLLQVAADTRFRADTAALNITYTASVAAVETHTPKANSGSIWVTPHLSLLNGVLTTIAHCRRRVNFWNGFVQELCTLRPNPVMPSRTLYVQVPGTESEERRVKSQSLITNCRLQKKSPAFTEKAGRHQAAAATQPDEF